METLAYHSAMKVLQYLGLVQPVNPLRTVETYEDKFVIIQGMFPLNLLDDRPYDRVYVGVKMPTSTKTNPFLLSNKNEKGSVSVFVVEWNSTNKPIFLYYRPGRWEKYLQKLKNGIDQEIDEIQLLNHQPIDDSGLFPDLE